MAKRLLVAEDQAIIRKLIRMTLQMAGYEVFETNNGVDAVIQAQALNPDLILLDVMMPGEIDGIEACRRLRQDARMRDVPIVMLSAKGQLADQDAGMEAGANDYVVKPFEPAVLVRVVQNLTTSGPSPNVRR
ncbi:response regulator [uncultured Rhodoferax sp.]|uniref:response regulator transcription factor n=1 Tax=uncultured Rhodoferax sp. TaxID=223188 RepID=UPI0025D49493|nr:response regulator [uncultured Rhodoferax sp.]